MSRIIEIHTTAELVKEDLFHAINYEIPNLKGVLKSEDLIYFYAEGTSVRGIDLSIEDYGYELQLNAMSSMDDHKITAIIIRYFRKMLDYGNIRDLSYVVDGEPVSNEKMWFWTALDNYNFEEEAKSLKGMSEVTESVVTIFGPTRPIHIGPYTLRKLGAGKEGWVKRLEALFLKILYHLPENESDNVMAFSRPDGQEIEMKSISPNVNYILDKYDYLCLSADTEELNIDDLIVFTNDILNENLPSEWERMDDYTIVAPGLTEEKHSQLLQKLKPFDCKEEVFFRKPN